MMMMMKTPFPVAEKHFHCNQQVCPLFETQALFNLSFSRSSFLLLENQEANGRFTIYYDDDVKEIREANQHSVCFSKYRVSSNLLPRRPVHEFSVDIIIEFSDKIDIGKHTIKVSSSSSSCAQDENSLLFDSIFHQIFAHYESILTFRSTFYHRQQEASASFPAVDFFGVRLSSFIVARESKETEADRPRHHTPPRRKKEMVTKSPFFAEDDNSVMMTMMGMGDSKRAKTEYDW